MMTKPRSLAGLVAALCFLAVLAGRAAGHSHSVPAKRVPGGLRASDWSSIRAAYEANRHNAFLVNGEYQARNPRQQWRTCFDGHGFFITPDHGEWSWGLELNSYGFSGHERAVQQPARVCVAGQRVEYEWDDLLTEWHINDQRGLEHGFTLYRRPAADVTNAMPLRLSITVRGNLCASVADTGHNVSFIGADGAVTLSYTGLTVLDADGQTLPARFETTADGLLLTINERGARYPLTIDPIAQQVYLKASNTEASDQFGYSVAVSGDTVVVGAFGEDSSAAGVNGDQSNNSASSAGAVYVFVREGSTWIQQAYLKASNPEASDLFGYSVGVSGDSVIVGAMMEDSSATGVDGDQANNAANGSGAAYIFVRPPGGSTWTQQAYLKASNTELGDWFGWSVAISGDTVLVGALREDSNATGVNGDQNNNNALDSGAVYLFVRPRGGSTWTQQAYLKASTMDVHDEFGHSLAISGDTALIGAPDEDSNATDINGNQRNNTAQSSGAAYAFVRPPGGSTWTQQAYLKASNTGTGDFFGISVAVSGDTAVVGSFMEDSGATGVNGDQASNAAVDSGAAYVFVRSSGGSTWSQQAYLKPSNTGAGDTFGESVAMSGDTVLVGALIEDSSTTGIDGDQGNNTAADSGAAYLFVRPTGGSTWTQQAYLKASNTAANDQFGESVAVSTDMAIVGARFEDSSATGINGDESDNGAASAGAVYVFDLDDCPPDLKGADLTGDGEVNAADLAQLLSAWGPCSPPGCCPADFNGDVMVDPADLAALLANWSS